MDPDQTARAAELQAHRRRLNLLREKAAFLGSSRDPSVDMEIEDIERRVAELEGAGVSEPGAADPRPWWAALPVQAGGDVFFTNIGAGAHGNAVGKNFTQVLTALGPAEPDDRQIIEGGLARVRAAFDSARGRLDPAIAGVSGLQLDLFAGELAKTGPDATPSANVIAGVGDWLLDNLPQLAAPLAGLLATPAAGRVIARAGEPALGWVRRRFGEV